MLEPDDLALAERRLDDVGHEVVATLRACVLDELEQQLLAHDAGAQVEAFVAAVGRPEVGAGHFPAIADLELGEMGRVAFAEPQLARVQDRHVGLVGDIEIEQLVVVGAVHHI